jgi:hypothetical protein
MLQVSAQRYRELQEAQAARDYSDEVDMEVLTSRYYTALRLQKAAEDAAASGQPIDMEVLTSRRYRVQQTAEALRIAQVSGQ